MRGSAGFDCIRERGLASIPGLGLRTHHDFQDGEMRVQKERLSRRDAMHSWLLVF
jgi:hypothetical protein